jgi:FkbM family methyltransferase
MNMGSQSQKASNRDGLFAVLGRQPFVHRLVAMSGVYKLANFVLEKFPVTRRLGKSGIKVRIDTVAGFALAEEMLGQSGYLAALEGFRVTTFVDLGCNVGWFPCLISAIQNDRSIRGLMVDGDPKMVESSRWHLGKNSLMNCEVLHGAAGCPEGISEITFHINPSNTQSSLKEFGSEHPFPVKGKVREVTVPCINVASEWRKRRGDLLIDCLKVDIEGAELDFLKAETVFIAKQVRRIVCEWHEWHVSLEEITRHLETNGFHLHSIVEQDEKGGVVVFDNKRMVASR